MVSTDKHIGKIDSILLTEYILYKYGAMSHLKLQKLLFYSNALHLAYFETPLIDDQFEAWVHGPVSRKVYNTVKDYSILYDNIDYVQTEEKTPDVLLRENLTEEQIELIDEVLTEYSKLSHLQLEALTHSEYPWQLARKGFKPADKCAVIIDNKITQEYYRDKVYGHEQA
jgi:uncharacterized phage-associated protein